MASTVLRNTIQANTINMVNSAAGDIGIYLDDGSDNNIVQNNQIRNAGTEIRDQGSDNTIGIDGGSS